MTAAAGGTPEVPVVAGFTRSRLARRLKVLRVQAGLNTRELAERVATSQSKVSRTELGKFRAPVELVRRWLEVTGADEDTRAEVLALATQSLVEVASYRSIFRGSFAAGQHIARQQEAVSARIRHFQPLMIPGLLQTEAYARAVLQARREFADGAGLQEAVAARMDRGARMRVERAPRYEVVLMEQALRWVPAGLAPPERAGAWRHLIAVSETPTITVRVIPLGTPTPRAPLCAFVITQFRPELDEPPIAQVELPPADLTFSADNDIDAFEALWRDMLGVSLTPSQTRKYLRTMLKTHPDR
jgi:transcriptional regulator with XRE-family HTH domain